VSRLELRVAEAARLGFKRLLVPAVCQREWLEKQKSQQKKRGSGSGKSSAGSDCELVPIEEVAQAVDWLERNGVGGKP
jgi:predicted ATP-dependent serine protease